MLAPELMYNAEYKRQYYRAHREEKLRARKAHYWKNREVILAGMKEFYERNRIRLLAGKKMYGKKNRAAITLRNKEARRNNVHVRLAMVLRSRLRNALQGNFKSGSAIKDLGCTIQELKFYLEGKFQAGMTWDNYGRDGWHIDHELPISFFDLRDREQYLKAFHYTNLQPLWATENRRKGKKVPTIHI